MPPRVLPVRRVPLALLIAFAAPALQVAAQGAPVAGPRELVGQVLDSAGVPIDSAEVTIEATRRSAFTGRDGVFRFDDVRPARYTIVARKIGYAPDVRRIAVAGGGASLTMRLNRIARGLPAVVTVATSSGLSGVVSDTARQPLAGADVEVIGGPQGTTTDSTGNFYLDVGPGRFMVRVTAEGFRPQRVSVTIPDGEGRRLAVWMTEGDDGAAARTAAAEYDLGQRLATRNAVYSRIFTREDLAKLNISDVDRLATAGATRRVGQGCDVILDGGPVKVPAWTLDAADLEFVEVYPPRPRRQVSVVMGMPGGSTSPTPTLSRTDDCNNVVVYAWLRR